MKEKTFNLIIVFAVTLILTMSGYVGYTIKKCPVQEPCPDLPIPKPAINDTIYLTEVKYLKEKKHENNPYVVRPVVYVSAFDSIAKYYGF